MVTSIARRARMQALALGLLLLGAALSAKAHGSGDEPRYVAGATTLCVVDSSRGFDETGGISDGKRLILVEAWYPVDAKAAKGKSVAKFGDYFAGDRDLLLRTERALLTTSGFAPAVVEANMLLAPAQFDVERGSYRDLPLARRGGAFPVIIYSHGTLQQRFTNDTLAESLARQGYIVLAPEHTGNDALAALGAYCPDELAEPGVKPASLDTNPAFDAARGEYRGQTFDPFFLVGNPSPETGTINPIEVALTLDRVGDYRASLKAARRHFGRRALIERGKVGLIGYSRGGMHGLVGAELISEIGASVSFVGGTPLLFYGRDAQAAPINEALERASRGHRDVLDRLTKPVLELIGGEDSRRKASTDVAAAIGVYPTPSQANPSPIVRDTFDNLGDTFGVLVQVTNIDHFDLVDDPFVIAYRARGGITRTGAFDPTKTYVTREVAERQAIRDHFTIAMFDRFIKGERGRGGFENPFASQGVTQEVNRARR
jgi:dienelactone hydrolase